MSEEDKPPDLTPEELKAADTPLSYQQLAKLARLASSTRQSLVNFDQRPNPPRGVRFTAGVLQWEAPTNSEQVTHYRVYANTEDTLAREVPSGQLQIRDGLSADRVFVSAINKFSGLESIKTLLAQQVVPTFSDLIVTDGIFTDEISPDSIFISTADGGLFQVESTKSGTDYTTDLELLNPVTGAFILLENRSIGGADRVLLDLQFGSRSIIAQVNSATALLTLNDATHTLELSPSTIFPNGPTTKLGDATHTWGEAWVDVVRSPLFYGANIIGEILTLAPMNLGSTPISVIEPSGTTTGNTVQLQTFGGTIFFKIVGGTDAVTPGTVVARDIVPFTDVTYKLGDSTHQWNEVWAQVVRAPILYGGSLIGGTLLLNSQNLGQTSIVVFEPSGTTTGNTIEFQSFGGTVFFKVIGGTDAGAPGTVVTRDVVPFTDDTYNLANTTHRWNTGWINRLVTQTSADFTGAGITAPSGAAGATFSSAIATLTVSGGIVVGFT